MTGRLRQQTYGVQLTDQSKPSLFNAKVHLTAVVAHNYKLASVNYTQIRYVFRCFLIVLQRLRALEAV